MIPRGTSGRVPLRATGTQRPDSKTGYPFGVSPSRRKDPRSRLSLFLSVPLCSRPLVPRALSLSLFLLVRLVLPTTERKHVPSRRLSKDHVDGRCVEVDPGKEARVVLAVGKTGRRSTDRG